MSLFKNFDWSLKSIAKILGLIFGGILAISLVTALVSFAYISVTGLFDNFKRSESSFSYDSSVESESAGFYGQANYGGMPSGVMTSDIAPPIMPTPDPNYSTGTTAEDFEVKTYDGHIRTKNLDEVCNTIQSLKEKSYVIFETADQDNYNCYYQFKVEKAQTESVLSFIEGLDPENLNANVTSIKKGLEGVETELDILTKKLESIEQTLTNAQTAYDEISQLATDQQNADVLAKIIDSKLNLIERLSSEKLNIKSQIDYYNKNKADQLDRLEFTFFNISVNKDVIFNWESLKENWKGEMKFMVENISFVLQAMTLKFVTYLLYFVIGVIYLFISVFLLKFVWYGVRRIWRSGNHPRGQ